MIEPEFVDDERLLLIQNYEPDIDDSVYKDTQETQETSFTQQNETPRRRPISDTRNRLKADMIESLFRHIGWDIDENMIDLHLDRYKIEQENGQTILSFKKGGKWFNLYLKNLGISILDMTPTDNEMNELTPQRLE